MGARLPVAFLAPGKIMVEAKEHLKLDEIDRKVSRYVAMHMPGELEVYLTYTKATYRELGKPQFDVPKLMEELRAENNA